MAKSEDCKHGDHLDCDGSVDGETACDCRCHDVTCYEEEGDISDDN